MLLLAYRTFVGHNLSDFPGGTGYSNTKYKYKDQDQPLFKLHELNNWGNDTSWLYWQ